MQNANSVPVPDVEVSAPELANWLATTRSGIYHLVSISVLKHSRRGRFSLRASVAAAVRHYRDRDRPWFAGMDGVRWVMQPDGSFRRDDVEDEPLIMPLGGSRSTKAIAYSNGRPKYVNTAKASR